MKIKLIDRKNYMFSIDTSKNRVYFRLQKGVWKIEDMDIFLSDWKDVIKEIQPNFTILSDIRNMQIQSPKLDKYHEEIQKYVTENGLLKVARVLPNNDIVNLQFGRIAERSSLPQNIFYTVEDAENFLDKIKKD
ncbi:hypothetical protein V9L05_20215 [Bernardetia sp. Wsw4-3y2]|uniref:hypothetical protein n=1 Tax=unclassified Bernardetia TaxID=2647129 RepID=UPI0030CCE551